MSDEYTYSEYLSFLKKNRLVGMKCRNGHLVSTPKSGCPKCGSSDLERMEFSGEGEVVTYTTIYVSLPKFADLAPYTVGIVKLREGPKVLARLDLVNLEDISIGRKVKFKTLEKRGELEAVFTVVV